MGGVVQSLFGGSSSKSSSNNQSYPWAMQNFGGSSAGGYNGGMGALAGILGIGGGSGGGSSGGTYFDLMHDGIAGDGAAARAAGRPTSGFIPGPGGPGGGAPGAGASGDPLQTFFNSGGGQFQLNQGVNAVNANMASRGLLDSGADMKGLENYRQGLASTYLQNFIGDLGNYAKLGLGGGGLVTSAGQQATGGGSESTGGLGQFIGQMAPLALSFI